MEWVVREPVPADAADLGRAHAAAWQVAYRGLMPAEALEGSTPENRTRMWERVLARSRAAREQIAVAEVEGAVVGFAWTGGCRDEGSPDGLGELMAINVHPDQWGSGVGSALLDAAHRALEESGFAEAVLWVLPGNKRARRFYEADGWRPDGGEREEELGGGQRIPEIRYRRHFEAEAEAAADPEAGAAAETAAEAEATPGK